jgi:hypothetical protein
MGKWPSMNAIATAAAPLACVAASRGGISRARKDARLAAVLSEFGYRTYVAPSGDDDVWLDDEAKLVVCDVVCPADDLPVEVALAATRGVEVVVLAPVGVVLDGMAGELLGLCNATVIRYDGVEPHRALHARLLG